MGDRGNIVVLHKRGDEIRPIWLYTHWRGSQVQEIAVSTLKGAGAGRIGDESYLTRILFDALTKGEHGTLGFGISPWQGDNEHDIVVIEGWSGRTAVVPPGLVDDVIAGNGFHPGDVILEGIRSMRSKAF